MWHHLWGFVYLRPSSIKIQVHVELTSLDQSKKGLLSSQNLDLIIVTVSVRRTALWNNHCYVCTLNQGLIYKTTFTIWKRGPNDACNVNNNLNCIDVFKISSQNFSEWVANIIVKKELCVQITTPPASQLFL